MPQTAPQPATPPVGEPPPRSERAARIAALAGAAGEGWFVPFRGGYLKAPVASIPHQLLVYRVENGRLIAELEEHARERGLETDELARRQESREVQALLHGFLAAKSADPKGPIQQELRRLAQQTEPLLVTAEGVLVNGNRRLAAMRALLAEDPGRYAGFAEVAAAVLPPDAGTADVEEVEAALQLTPETKLAYGWINRRLKLRRQSQASAEAAVQAFRLEGREQLDRELRELELAEDYLDDYLGHPGRYSLAADAEILFSGLAERLRRLPAELRGPWRRAGFAMIAGRAAVKGPMDRHFPFAEPLPEHMPAWALRRFAEERELVAAHEGPSERAALDAGTLQALESVFADPGRADELAAELFALMERLRAEHQEDNSPARLIKIVEKLHDALARMRPDRLSDAQRLKLRAQLAAIRAEAQVLLGEDAPPAEEEDGLAGRVARLLGRR
jgi:hypothetical protein